MQGTLLDAAFMVFNPTTLLFIVLATVSASFSASFRG